ncbi:DUF1049 domain-containing protein [Pasteurellaceae bacterium TAE3-ERU1]|uniref:LapA family protein n=1 Tax=Spirabiliibacterium mucosae TaxID=28156 RepID=UPI001AACC84C|nr:lipopolysaccharide assembly protein LapA domain-containing protein [Spirabiliibacterium mucosae]MBE2897431.1 DUF1049 domain-containing protein [Spirabiliibacterium mucosae]MBV7387787.1 DUF1049 domain-containing protein [Pasteurellaceae bacterium TAE3-ERU1]
MIKFFLGFVIILAIVIVAVTIGADNDQVITFNYIIAKSELQLSSLVAILFGLGLLLGWLISAYFVLRLKMKNMSLNRQVKRQAQQISELNVSHKPQ